VKGGEENPILFSRGTKEQRNVMMVWLSSIARISDFLALSWCLDFLPKA